MPAVHPHRPHASASRLPFHALLFAALLACAPLPAPAQDAAPAAERPLVFGISDIALAGQRAQIEGATALALRSVLPSRGLRVVHYSVLDLERAVIAGEVDMMLSSAGLSRRLAPYGVRPIATVTAPGLEDPNANEGSLIIVRADSGLKTLSDLAGKTLSANLSWGFSGYQIAMREIADAGYSWEKFFRQGSFAGRSAAMRGVVDDVLSGRSDVGILRLCALENFAASDPSIMDRLRVIHELPAPGIACRTSTRLYPAQTISVTPRVSPALAREMTLSLLSMPPTPSGHTWSIATSYNDVDELLRTLQIGPYRYLREWSLSRFLRAAWPWLMLAAAAVAGLIWHSRRTDRMLAEREALLRRLFLHEQEQTEKLANLQRSSTVAQISSLVAHELRQPLAALTFYADAIGMMTSRGALEPERMTRLSQGISREAKKASDIVENVRRYAKSERSERIRLTPAELAGEAMRQLKLSRRALPAIETRIDEDCGTLLGNRLELVLSLVNLLKNGRDAAEHTAAPEGPALLLEAGAAPNAPGMLRMAVTDNGPPISEAEFSRLGMPAQSRKTDGLGLGLSITATIAESHGGRLVFSRSELPGYPGICAALILPAAPEPGSGKESSDHAANAHHPHS